MVNALACAAALLAVHSTPAKEISCAVMTMNTVDIDAATRRHQYADYKGRRYFFCCGACPAAFKNHPERFAKNPSLPIPAGQ